MGRWLYHEGLLNWIHRRLLAMTTQHGNRSSKASVTASRSSSASSSGPSTRHWRHLSPEYPPLPTISIENDTNELTLYTSCFGDALVEPASHHQRSSYVTLSPADRALYTIPEETMATSSSITFRSSLDWIKDEPPQDSLFDPDWVGNEEFTRQAFAKMAPVATSQQVPTSNTNNCSDANRDCHRNAELLFDPHHQLRFVCLQSDDGVECWRFHGVSQYIPPEVASRGIYVQKAADVWAMGICLYRMLVGQYPFIASDDQMLFKKMAKADFHIPSHLSEDAKDLLRRMLAPLSKRASLDLVHHHRWLRLYSSASYPLRQRQEYGCLAPAPASVPDDDPAVVHTPPPLSQSRHIQVASQRPSTLERAIEVLLRGPYAPPKHLYPDLMPH